MAHSQKHRENTGRRAVDRSAHPSCSGHCSGRYCALSTALTAATTACCACLRLRVIADTVARTSLLVRASQAQTENQTLSEKLQQILDEIARLKTDRARLSAERDAVEGRCRGLRASLEAMDAAQQKATEVRYILASVPPRPPMRYPCAPLTCIPLRCAPTAGAERAPEASRRRQQAGFEQGAGGTR